MLVWLNQYLKVMNRNQCCISITICIRDQQLFNVVLMIKLGQLCFENCAQNEAIMMFSVTRIHTLNPQ